MKSAETAKLKIQRVGWLGKAADIRDASKPRLEVQINSLRRSVFVFLRLRHSRIEVRNIWNLAVTLLDSEATDRFPITLVPRSVGNDVAIHIPRLEPSLLLESRISLTRIFLFRVQRPYTIFQ